MNIGYINRNIAFIVVCLIVFVLLLPACKSGDADSWVADCAEDKYFSTNDVVQLKGLRCNGRREGTWTAYNHDGGVAGTMEFLNGMPHGKTRIFGIQGRLKYTFSFGYQGKLDGEAELWYGSSMEPYPSIRGQFVCGKPMGLWEWLNPEDGKRIGFQVYTLDSLVVDSMNRDGRTEIPNPILLFKDPLRLAYTFFGDTNLWD